jgi:hypothetical protein
MLAASWRSIWNVEQSGYWKVGLAIEENLLDSKTVALRGAKDSRIEWRPFGKTADK